MKKGILALIIISISGLFAEENIDSNNSPDRVKKDFIVLVHKKEHPVVPLYGKAGTERASIGILESALSRDLDHSFQSQNVKALTTQFDFNNWRLRYIDSLISKLMDADWIGVEDVKFSNRVSSKNIKTPKIIIKAVYLVHERFNVIGLKTNVEVFVPDTNNFKGSRKIFEFEKGYKVGYKPEKEVFDTFIQSKLEKLQKEYFKDASSKLSYSDKKRYKNRVREIKRSKQSFDTYKQIILDYWTRNDGENLKNKLIELEQRMLEELQRTLEN